MSHPHGIDNEEQLFHFDCYEEPELVGFTPAITGNARPGPHVIQPKHQMSAHDDSSTSGETCVTGDAEISGKGKAATRPVPIRTPVADLHDLFDMSHSPSTASSPSHDSHCSSILTSLTASSFDQYSLYNAERQHRVSPIIYDTGEPNVDLFVVSPWKGKGKELPPVLPPLTFSSAEFSYASSLSSTLRSLSPGPSSYGSNSGLPLPSVTTNSMLHQQTSATIEPAPPVVCEIFPPSDRIPSRPRSLSSLSVRSDKSLAARSMSRIKSKMTLPRTSNLARKLLFRKAMEPEVSSPDLINAQITIDGGSVSGINYPGRWRTGLKVDELDVTISRLSDIRSQEFNLHTPSALYPNTARLKHKGRSNSSPFPLSALEYISVPPTDIFLPFPLVVRNYFDEVLPHELQLHVFKSLVSAHEADHLRAIREGRWSFGKASSSKSRWVGRNKGLRELVKLSRVSKSWQTLAFDGQLWTNLDLHAFPGITESLILRLTTIGGHCIRALNISGIAHISAAALLDMADHFCVNSSLDTNSLCYTQLTTINVQGCSSLTTRSLHHLLIRCRSLEKLCVKGLPAVANTTFNIISTYCTGLVSLNVSRCSNITAEGIKSFATAALERGDHLLLKELRMCGLEYIDDDTMSVLGQATPFLEVLDISYARQLHNSAMDAFVACDDDEGGAVETLLVSPREVGRESSDDKIRRRVTRLRHLSMSHCLLLTDDVCSNLALSVPHLEFLEMAGIGPNIEDDGLVRLLNTTPHIRRLDLEDASHVSDAVLAAVTPSANSQQVADAHLEPGYALEYLNVSFAADITDDAFLALIRGCKRLKYLEADNTRIGSAVVKEFVRECRKRKASNTKAVVVDCRGITDGTVKDLSSLTRPRMGWRAHEAKKLAYLDNRDGNVEELRLGQDECDEKRVVLKSFYSWQTVDAVKAAREKRRKAFRKVSNGNGSEGDDTGRALRWWAPGGRRTPQSGWNTPANNAIDVNNDGCRLM